MEVIQTLWVDASTRSPSLWPGTDQVLTTLPWRVYSTMVLVMALLLPSLTLAFW